MTKADLEVKGMYCAHCSKAVEEAFKRAEIEAHVDLAKNKVHFTFDESKISLEYLRRLVKRAGYELVIDQKKRFNINLVLVPVSIVVLLFSLLGIVYHFGVDSSFFFFFGNDITFLVIASIAIAVLGTPFFIRAAKGLRFKNVGMDFLISLSALCSYILSLYIFVVNIQNGIDLLSMHAHHQELYRMTYFDGTCMILSIITLGHLLTDRIKINADKNYQKSSMKPPEKCTLVYPDGSEEEMDCDNIDVGDTIKVISGEQIALDGHVVQGEGYIDESSMTGESKPRFVRTADSVLGGTFVSAGPLYIQADKIALDSLYSSIIDESYVLDNNKGNLSKISDKIAGIFTPAIVLVALLSFFVCLFGMSLDVEESVVRACSVLSVSCPCAFGLAVPISTMSGYNSALKNGILFKSGDTFERIRNIKACVFDKTGTLSTGKMTVRSYIGDNSLIPVIKGFEKNSMHPIALSIMDWKKDLEASSISSPKEIPGLGLQNDEYTLGNEKSCMGKEISEDFVLFKEQNKDSTLIFLSDKEKVLFIISLEDELAPDSLKTITKLKEMGIASYMVTGDRKEYALKLAEQLGIPSENVIYECSPKDKASVLREIRNKEGTICYVGDGINDTLALKESDLSFASFKASSIACSSADALLLNSGLYSLIEAFRISKKTYVNIVENFVWAILYNICMIPLAIMGILPMYLCAALMIVSNLTLTINSLRIAGYDPKKEDKNNDNQSK